MTTSISKNELCNIFTECEKALHFTNTHLNQQVSLQEQQFDQKLMIHLPCFNNGNTINKAKAVLRKKLQNKKMTL